MSDQDVLKSMTMEEINRDESLGTPKIEYPCDYPIKVLGETGPNLYKLVTAVMEAYSPGFDQSKTTIRDSKNGTFQAITVTITATSVDQLQALFDDLKVSPLVKMVI
jgi:putative lipoic acid-binding regulatory protein